MLDDLRTGPTNIGEACNSFRTVGAAFSHFPKHYPSGITIYVNDLPAQNALGGNTGATIAGIPQSRPTINPV